MAYVALGSNVGDRSEHLAAARHALSVLPQSRLIAESIVEETAPIGPSSEPFLNQIVAIETSLDPDAMLDALQEIEASRGREHHERWGARTLDLDIVAFEDGRTVNTPRITVPHRELRHRDFWHRELDDVRQQLARRTATEDVT